MDDLLYLIYTHREYDDILQIQLKRLYECFPDLQYIAICSNDIEHIKEKYGKSYKLHFLYQYDNNAVYGERLRSVFAQIKQKYVLFNHEINILVQKVDSNRIDNILSVMEVGSIDQVRLFESGIENPILDSNLLHPIEKGYFFSCNSAIWRTESLLHLTETFRHVPFRSFEAPAIQSYTANLKNYYVSTTSDFVCPGEGHYFCFVFPVIHITHNGKWRMTPFHKPFILNFAEEFSIDLAERGLSF